MSRKFLISIVALFILSMLLGLIVHGLLLHSSYAALPGLFRPPQDAEGYFPFMLLAHLSIAAGFVWIYLKGREDKPFLGQGVRFGAGVAVLTSVPTYLIYYAVQPMPGILVLQQIVLDSLGMVIMGITVAWLNREGDAG